MRISMLGTAGAAALATVVVVVAGCSSDEGKAPGTPPVGGADAGTAAPTGTFELIVVEPARTTAEVTAARAPVAGALVALTPPGGGEPIEVTTGADGLAKFTGLDWSLGDASLVLAADGSVPLVLVGVKPRAPRIKIANYAGLSVSLTKSSAVADPALATIQGSFTNKADPAHGVILAPDVPGSFFQEATASYALTAKNDAPFKLYGTEYGAGPAPALQTFFKWFVVDVPAGTTKVDIDVAATTALPSRRARHTLMLPGGAGGPLGGASAYTVMDLEGLPLSYGYATEQTPSADGASIAVTTERLETVPPGAPRVFHSLSRPDGAASYVFATSAPAEGAVIDGFLPPPVVASARVAFMAPVAVEGLSPQTIRTLEYYDGAATTHLLQLQTFDPLGEATWNATMPKLPASVLAKLPAGDLATYVTEVSDEIAPQPFTKFVRSAPFSTKR